MALSWEAGAATRGGRTVFPPGTSGWYGPPACRRNGQDARSPQRLAGVDPFDVYLRQGKRSYGIAGELTGDKDVPPAAGLQQLSAQFEYCVHGLRLVRAGWERLNRPPGRN
jgi:hypothetical protein